MLQKLSGYKNLGKSIIYIIIVEFFVQLVNVSYINILPLYMQAEGYTDAEYAHFTSYRYLGMLSLAVFIGMYIKGKRLLPFFYIAAIGIPLFGLLILTGVHFHSNIIILIAHLLWGTAYTFIQIPILPYILRNSPSEQHTLGITLNFATWSMATISSGIFIGLLNQLNPQIFNEKNLLFILTGISFLSVYFISKVSKHENVPEKKHKLFNIKYNDWNIIIKAITPSAIIAFGAGFTIPFISLFFSNVHGLSTSSISYISFVASFIVFIASMYVPNIKNKYGYKKAVPVTQSFSIIALVFMATTQHYNHLSIAVYVAIIFYLIRQPLMNIASPMTSEITLKYVGEKNQEITSALISAIWSGSTYFSAILFGILRSIDMSYSSIFLITAGFYTIGVIGFYLLIIDFEKSRTKIL